LKSIYEGLEGVIDRIDAKTANIGSILVGSRTGATLRRFSLRVEENYVDFRLSLALSCGSSKLDAA
jgi:hypothetical protein